MLSNSYNYYNCWSSVSELSVNCYYNDKNVELSSTLISPRAAMIFKRMNVALLYKNRNITPLK